MASLEARVKRLEDLARQRRRRADPELRLRAAELRVSDGTARPEDYLMCYREEIEFERKEYVASAPVYLAAVRAGLYIDSWVGLIAYPPDSPLPTETTDHLQLLKRVSSTTRVERQAQKRRGAFFARHFSVEERTLASMWRLVLGDQEGLSVRRQAWVVDGGRWALAPEVLDESQFYGIDLVEVEHLFSGPIATSTGAAKLSKLALEHVDVVLPPDQPPWIPYSTLAAVIEQSGVTDRWGSQTWSDQVKGGQASRK